MAKAPAPMAGALARRDLLRGAGAAVLATACPSGVRAQADGGPPAFSTVRSQFTLIAPRVIAPPLPLRDLQGRDVILTLGRGRVTLVNLWATWCALCREDLPMMGRLERHGMANLTVVPICTDTSDATKITQYLRRIGEPKLGSYVDLSGTVATDRASSTGVFRARAMPITYVIGKDGHIEGYITGAADWMSESGMALIGYYAGQA